ncbi:hypothetical protein BJX76DRAFT_260425 [Aspergillus varians]
MDGQSMFLGLLHYLNGQRGVGVSGRLICFLVLLIILTSEIFVFPQHKTFAYFFFNSIFFIDRLGRFHLSTHSCRRHSTLDCFSHSLEQWIQVIRSSQSAVVNHSSSSCPLRFMSPN